MSAPGPARTLEGVGLHSGNPCRVTVRRTRPDDPVTLSDGVVTARADALVVRRADHGVAVTDASGALAVDSVEHLFAALGGLGVRGGVSITVEGGELPLLDGAAALYVDALLALEPAEAPPPLTVTRRDVVHVAHARYEFVPGTAPRLEVAVDFAVPAIGEQHASWDGSPRTFRTEIAWARTFGFRKDGPALVAAGRARGVDSRSVIVLEEDGTATESGLPARPGELARHKLLDLVGDAYLFGGPPHGVVRALKPGHGATHRAFALALDRGVLARA